MKKRTAILLLTLLSFVGAANAQPDDLNVTLGFSCGFTGMPTAPAETMAALVKSNNVTAIVSKLESTSAADQFLAVVVLEYLEQKQRIALSERLRERIDDVKKSDKAVPLCSGCMFGDKASLKSLLRDIDTIGTTNWLEGLPL